MDIGLLSARLRGIHIGRLLYFVGIIATVLSLFHSFAYPNGSYLSTLSHANLIFVSDGKPFSNKSNLADSYIIHGDNGDRDNALSSDGMRQMDSDKKLYHGSTFEGSGHVHSYISAKKGSNIGRINISSGKECLGLGFNSVELKERSTRMPLVHKNEPKFKDNVLLQGGSFSAVDKTVVQHKPALRKRGGKAMSISQMNSLLLNISAGMKSKKPRWPSLDQELQHAKVQIENAPIQRDVSEDHASLFRNYSMFKRSYELMENTLKVYVYREGAKPTFHMPYMRGIYASEGWFMKLIERNKQFVTKDPKRAHLFYLAFSSVKLRNARNGSNLFTQKDMQNHLKNYVDIIANKYRFWNKKGGADHFLVACHDWIQHKNHLLPVYSDSVQEVGSITSAPRLTRHIFGSCIRVLCNSNIGQGFKIGKDVSLPVTYIRSSENPLKDIGGNPLSHRPILAFFAGGMHGYVRPILLQYWHNKEPDMKIIGPMPRDIEGKAKYREYMKSSKYCICAKGYEVHTPRVIESIYYECVPVIISDNYVPPLFEVFDWESFAVFVSEDEIANLREILLSVPEDRYVMMQHRVKMVKQYFLWHKVPLKYDLFHMILHSVWQNRVFQVSS